MRRALLAGLLLIGACRAPAPARVPSAHELSALGRRALVGRFQAVDAAMRNPAPDGPRIDDFAAGHAAFVAHRRFADGTLERLARRWLTRASTAGAAHVCDASEDLAELERRTGHDRAAQAVVETALRSGDGSLACRGRLRALGSAVGLELPVTAFGVEGVRATLTDVDVMRAEGQDGTSVRVVVSLDHEARGELVPPSEGDGRARLRFSGVRIAPSVTLPIEVADTGLVRVEAANGATTGLDFVVDPDVTVRAYAVDDPVRWVLDFDRPAATDAPARTGPPRLIVLDPGHGGDEHGARVDGTRESHLVLDIATRAAAELRARLPTTRVLLTRTTDDEVSLEARSAMANSLDADLFVSIHLNDADVPVSTGGITTFVLDTEDPRQAVRLAARENTTTTDRVSGLSVLLAGLHRTTQVGESRRLASFVHASALAHARTVLPALPDRGVRSQMFYVLVGTRMPAILVECSFMTRPEELTALRTERYRRELATGIAEGITLYAGSR